MLQSRSGNAEQQKAELRNSHKLTHVQCDQLKPIRCSIAPFIHPEINSFTSPEHELPTWRNNTKLPALYFVAKHVSRLTEIYFANRHVESCQVRRGGNKWGFRPGVKLRANFRVINIQTATSNSRR